MRIPSLLSALLLLTCPAAELLAQHCGAVLTTSVTLSRDLDCRGHPVALKVAASGVTISLAGHRVSGDHGNIGIAAQDLSDLRVLGPGRIENFDQAITAHNVDRLQVLAVDVINAASRGIALQNSRDARVERNRFRGFMEVAAVDVRQPVGTPGGAAGGHVIRDNLFESLFRGVWLCGADAGGNLIQGNRFQDIFEDALMLDREADANQVLGNKFVQQATVVLASSSGNLVRGNVFERGSWGLFAFEVGRGACVTRRSDAAAAENRVLDNHMYDTSYPLVFGDGARKNRIAGNTVRNAVVGLEFRIGAETNDGRGNAFPGTRTPVVDAGVGNLY